MAENLQHEDFGEKIGGAKKDLWKDRGLYVDDLGAMNEREAEKFVKKDNVWKKPDYQAMLDDGVPLGVVYFIKKARDSLGLLPNTGTVTKPRSSGVPGRRNILRPSGSYRP